MKLAEFSYQLTEGGIMVALRDIYNFYHDKTGQSYIKTTCIEKHRAFE